MAYYCWSRCRDGQDVDVVEWRPLVVPEPDVVAKDLRLIRLMPPPDGNSSLTAASTASLTRSDGPVDIQSFTHNSLHCQHVYKLVKGQET